MEVKESSKNLNVNLAEFEFGICPVCGSSFDGGLILDKYKEIREKLRGIGLLESGKNKFFNQTDEEFSKEIEKCYSLPYKFSEIVGIEIPGIYDEISAWTCTKCNSFWARFSGEYLGESLTANELTSMKDKLSKIKIVQTI